MSQDQVENKDVTKEPAQEPSKGPHRFILDFGSAIATLDIQTHVLTFVSPSGVVNGQMYIPPSSFSIGDPNNLALLRDVINNYYPAHDKNAVKVQELQDRVLNLISVINDQQETIRKITKESEERDIEKANEVNKLDS